METTLKLFEPVLRSMAVSSAHSALLPVDGLIGREVNLDEFLHALVDRIAVSMQADRGTLYLLDPSKGELFSRAAYLPELKQIRLKVGQGVAGAVAQDGVAINIPSAKKSPRFNADIDKLTGYTTSSLLAVPLRDEAGVTFGVLQMLNRKGSDRFDEADERRLTAMAQQLSQALQATSLFTELNRAKESPAQPVGYFFNNVIGESAPMTELYRIVQKAAQTDATVLLRGESGTGKELFARAVHVNSRRKTKPFVKVDCAALPGSLIENELFGHEKGAFTGAEARQRGKFEAADGGTVFIDELGELPLPVQSKLLRVLQDKQFERVGGTQTISADVRIVAATHRDLAAMVRAGTFREDLYYRVKVVELQLPPLRERGGDDIERLARHFVTTAAKRHHVKVPRLSPAALERLKGWRWPGNVRELENCIESAVVLSDGVLLPEHLPLPLAAAPLATARTEGGTLDEVLTLAEVEKRHILGVVARAEGNKSQAAKLLGIGRNTLIRKLRDIGVEPGDETT